MGYSRDDLARKLMGACYGYCDHNIDCSEFAGPNCEYFTVIDVEFHGSEIHLSVASASRTFDVPLESFVREESYLGMPRHFSNPEVAAAVEQLKLHV